jgi:phage/plasmid primase-like uncharacterized protein
LEVVQGINSGRTKAAQTAALVDGKVLLPIFAPDENDYPESVELVTPEMYREHMKTGTTISDEQMVALAKMKHFTDFNDLGTRRALGKEGVSRQVRSVLDALVENHQLQQQARQQRPSAHHAVRSDLHRSANLS